MSETTKGLLAIVSATMIWGLSPMFYKQLAEVPPLEVLAHRTLWSLLFFGALMAGQGRLGELRALLSARRSAFLVGFAALMISTNWFIFILSIQIGRALEASLGYYIFPLVAVLFGALVFGERLSAARGVAIALAVAAVITLTAGLGAAPWISLVLATTFGLYGLLKKYIAAGPVASVTGEVALLAPLAAVWLWGVHTQGWTGVTGRHLAAFGTDLKLSLLLALSGLITALPLILFSRAARLLPMGTVGIMQYINPTLQFLVASLVFGEVVTRWHWVALPMIWLAVLIYSVDTLRQERMARRRSRAS